MHNDRCKHGKCLFYGHIGAGVRQRAAAIPTHAPHVECRPWKPTSGGCAQCHGAGTRRAHAPTRLLHGGRCSRGTRCGRGRLRLHQARTPCRTRTRHVPVAQEEPRLQCTVSLEVSVVVMRELETKEKKKVEEKTVSPLAKQTKENVPLLEAIAR